MKRYELERKKEFKRKQKDTKRVRERQTNINTNKKI